MIKKINAIIVVTLSLCATLAASPEAANAESVTKRFALSGSVLGRGTGLGLELEAAMTPYFRISTGVSTGLFFFCSTRLL